MIRSLLPRWRAALWAVFSLVAAIAIWGGSKVYAGVRADWLVASWCEADYDLGDSSASVFAPDKLLTFEFELSPEDLALMRSDPKAEKYVPAQLNVGCEQVGRIGLRFKGSVGTLHHLRDDRLKQARLPKLSLKINFGKYEKGSQFRGLTRLNFHSMLNDESLMRDRVAYGLFRSAGLIAPRCGHARVVINGEYQGVFAMVEQIDQAFVDEHLGDAKQGVLYKEIWPRWTGADSYRRKAKEDPGAAGTAPVQALARALRSAEDSELPEVVAQWCDMDDLLRYLVVDQILRNWDGVTRFSTRTSKVKKVFYNHNCYWYQSSAGKLTLIPWDLDQTLQFEHDYSAVPSFYELDVTEAVRYPGDGDIISVAPACNPLIRAVALYARGRYAGEAKAQLDGWFAQDRLDARITEWSDQIRSSVALDPHVGQSNWEERVQDLRGEITKIHTWMTEVVAEIEEQTEVK